MILQEGRYYRARNGRAYGPINKSREFFYPFFFGEYTWTKEGKSTIGPDSPHDLIAEITELEAKPPVAHKGATITCLMVDPFHDLVALDATPKVDRVVLASKILPRLAPDLTPSMAARQALQYADAFLKEISNGNDQG